MSSPMALVREFHRTFDLPAKTTPDLGDEALRKLRLALIEEELAELELALAEGDEVETADALADLVYVVYGAALSFGIPLDAVVAEVHRSNMTKLWDADDIATLPGPGDGQATGGEFIDGYQVAPGRWVVTRGGKVMKPPTFEQPLIKEVLKLADFWAAVWPGEVL